MAPAQAELPLTSSYSSLLPQMATKWSTGTELWSTKCSSPPGVLQGESQSHSGRRLHRLLCAVAECFRVSIPLVAGFKPLLVLRLVSNEVGGDLTWEQSRAIERVKQETGQAERELYETIATVQESVAAPPLLALARRVGRLMEGEIFNIDEAIETMKNGTLRVLESASALRGSNVRKVVEVLSPDQTVKFLAAAADLGVAEGVPDSDKRLISSKGTWHRNHPIILLHEALM